MQRWIREDLTRASTLANANFLVAMGIFNYIEILGSFYEISEAKGYARRRFDFAFEDLMGDQYKEVSDQLKSFTNSSYESLRCGMTHEYLVKTYKANVTLAFTVAGVGNQQEFDKAVQDFSCGVILEEESRNKFLLSIINPRLIHDLDRGFEQYKNHLKNEEYKERFLNRCKTIHLEKFIT